ncbi:hypothetical protein BRADI_5g26655v3 [Brachypodium distachyon]|uniref:Uncharacterized protein n=1 Tax=Brachypodium distachyon TaxID=15368 RepID=A0A0Q3EC61_BRADI|nr:hypothetical protein BRADI_5g26655v3 [Brachypodium distachyon]
MGKATGQEDMIGGFRGVKTERAPLVVLDTFPGKHIRCRDSPLHEQPSKKFALLRHPAIPEETRVLMPNKTLELSRISSLGGVHPRGGKLPGDGVRLVDERQARDAGEEIDELMKL